LHLLPHLWFRNQWSWWEKPLTPPEIRVENSDEACLCANDANLPSLKYLLFDYHLNDRYLYGPAGGKPLFTENESNCEALWKTSSRTPYVKDAFHRYLIDNKEDAINPKQVGTKAALHYFEKIEPGKSAVFTFRLTP